MSTLLEWKCGDEHRNDTSHGRPPSINWLVQRYNLSGQLINFNVSIDVKLALWKSFLRLLAITVNLKEAVDRRRRPSVSRWLTMSIGHYWRYLGMHRDIFIAQALSHYFINERAWNNSVLVMKTMYKNDLFICLLKILVDADIYCRYQEGYWNYSVFVVWMCSSILRCSYNSNHWWLALCFKGLARSSRWPVSLLWTSEEASDLHGCTCIPCRVWEFNHDNRCRIHPCISLVWQSSVKVKIAVGYNVCSWVYMV